MHIIDIIATIMSLCIALIIGIFMVGMMAFAIIISIKDYNKYKNQSRSNSCVKREEH